MNESPTVITDALKIGENDHGYWFGVCRMSGRGVGFAMGRVRSGNMMCLLPGISEGCVLGLEDRDKAIRMAGVIAQSSEHGYGGVARWFVEEHLRGKPDDFRWANCESVGCSGQCDDDFYAPTERE
jgi:hypothetical protein